MTYKIFLKIYLFIFRERGREGEREKHQCGVASRAPATGDLARNPGMCLCGNQTCNPLVRRPVLNPLSHASQVTYKIFNSSSQNHKNVLYALSSFLWFRGIPPILWFWRTPASEPRSGGYLKTGLDSLKECKSWSPGQTPQLVKTSSQYAKVTGSILGQGTYKKQAMSA